MSAYRPTGDQPRAIAELAESLRAGNRGQTLLGATGTGKTATMAWVMEELTRRLSEEGPGDAGACNGPLLSRTQYRRELEQEGYPDVRQGPEVGMTEQQAREWTEAGVREGHG